MRILFSNEKGGVGKSTHCTLFANYLCSLGKEVHVYDMDKQRTIERMRDVDEEQRISVKRENEENVFDDPLNFEVSYWSLNDDIQPLLDETANGDGYYLFDTPANIENLNMIRLMSVADCIIIPFEYERTILDSTTILIQILDAIKTPAKKIFIPNRVKYGIRIDSMQQVDKLLSSVGFVTPVVPDRVDIRRYSTLLITGVQKKILTPIYDSIMQILAS